ncbi:DUF4226 domain-containing protein [Mycobacterium sp. 29Ha]|uniref:DUF4226 domain-containing protein n=1 Tax=Mycobacterium sp. 29Ha TaxID=2939268 RepID=UPI0029390483|nr:DUF4226 domain-containing protein [Mycobacterium sp. 29Ha]
MEGALLVSVGLPDVMNNVVFDAIENIAKVVGAVGRIFGEDKPHDLPPAPPYPGTVPGVPPYPGMPPASPPPPPAPPPGSQGGLNTGATGAGEQYNGSTDAAQLTDEKLAELLKQIFASNQGARDKVSAILTEIQNRQKQMAPEMGNPASVASFGQFLDQKFAEVQKVLADARVDAKTQAAILDALGDEYRNNGPDAHGGSGGGQGAGGGGDSSGGGGEGSGGGGGEVAGGGGAGGPAGGEEPLMDPLAGMGGLGGPMGMDPMSAMGPALAGLSALPQALGGMGASPLDALGPALSSLGGLGGLANGGFTDKPPTDGKPEDGFKDEPAPEHDKPQKDSPDTPGDQPGDPHTQNGQPGTTTPPDPTTAPAGHGTPEQAAPATAPAPVAGEAARNVTMPDGQVVTAPDAQSAQVMRSVLSGTSVTDAYKQVGVDLAPPGTPVTDPVDPNTMPPGSVGRFDSRGPVMAMGNGKIWLDGQLQPLGALGSSGDFLGWSKPPTTATTAPAVPATAPPAPSGPPAAT